MKVAYDANNNPVGGLLVPTRVHVLTPEEWNRAGGTDFWAVFGPEAITAAAGSSALITDSGWTATSLVETAGTGADFLATADRSKPAHILTDAASDLLQSPSIFGDYMHAQVAASILGYQPTKMACEFGFAMTVNSANETTSGIGLVEAGGTAGTAADDLAWLVSDGTNFKLRSGAATSAAGALIDTNWHVAKIVLDNSVAAGTAMVSWYLDGALQGTLDLETDLFPCSFGMFAGVTNRPALSFAHIWYY